MKDLAYLKLLAGQYPTEAKALAEMIRIALQLSELKERAGRDQPTVIT